MTPLPAPITAEAPAADNEATASATHSVCGRTPDRALGLHHRFMLAISLLIIGASFLLRNDDTGHVNIPGLNATLPPVCPSRALLNVECAGCGLTRSFVALAHGDLAGSLRYHRLGWLLALAVVAQIPYRLLALHELRANKIVARSWPLWIAGLLVAALLVNWLLKMSALY